MKKKLLSLMAAVLALGMLAGCGSDNGTVLKDMNVEKYVTLGEYKGLAVNVAKPTVDDAEWEALVMNVYQGYITEENGVKDRAIELGDTVNIDYEGKKDGVAFEGGTSAGYNLTIGSGSFIEGFEEGLVGVKPGETVDLELTFPEAYHSADLAGQAVVFTVTVNYIMPTELDDTVIAGMGIEGVTNTEEFRQHVYDYLYMVAEENYNASVENAVLDAFMANNTIENVPEALIEKYETVSRTNIENTAASYGTDADTFTNYYYGMDLETFVTTYCEEAAKQDMAFQAVANAENLNISDEELDEMLMEYAESAGYTSIEEYIGETSKEDYREYFLYDKVLNYLVENAVISE